MKYDTATILFRDGEDDYTLWVVDLPEETVLKFKKSECAIVGELDSLLEQLPIEPGNPSNRIHLLSSSCERYTLYTTGVIWGFFEKYMGDGASSRGNKETILSEINELSHPRVCSPKLVM